MAAECLVESWQVWRPDVQEIQCINTVCKYGRRSPSAGTGQPGQAGWGDYPSWGKAGVHCGGMCVF